ncbi:MAG TPA: Fic family protein [Terriglobales bacterium]|jgi:Fic family protein
MVFRAEKLMQAEKEVIARIEEARKTLKYNLASPRRWNGLLRRNTLARAVRGSNSIEGYNVTAEDAIAAVEGEEPLNADKEAWLAVTGYRTAMTFVLQLTKDKNFIYSEGFLRGLHFMMLHYDLNKHPGNWRPGTVYVHDESKNEVVYEGPDVEMVPGLIEELIEYLNDEDDCPHALVKGAMAHLNLVMIHPFSDGNGRMARCLQTLVLGLEGILEPEFSSIEEYLGRNTQDYYNILARTGEGSWHPRNGTRDWIRFNLTAHFRQATTLVMRTKVMGALWQELELELKRRGLPERLIYAIADGAIGYRVRNSSYRNLAGLNDVLASRDLKTGVDAGLLIPDGERRGRVYVGSPQMRALFDKLKSEHIKPVPDPFTASPDQLRLPS